MDERVSALYTSHAQFQDLLDRAADNADDEGEIEFVVDIQQKFNTFGIEMFLSEKQNEVLRRIAAQPPTCVIHTGYALNMDGQCNLCLDARR